MDKITKGDALEVGLDFTKEKDLYRVQVYSCPMLMLKASVVHIFLKLAIKFSIYCFYCLVV